MREFFAELLEEIAPKKLFLHCVQDPRLDFVAADRQTIGANPLVVSAEARKPVFRLQHEPAAAHATLGEAREQVLWPARLHHALGGCEHAPCRLLAPLGGRPQLFRNDSQLGNFLRDPLGPWIQPRNSPTVVRVLDVPEPVPDQSSDIQLIVENARAARRVPVDRARIPARPEWSGDPLCVEPLRNLFW
ncbi:MAG TPA: hypothetical protein VM364_18980 [Vicinamibacterales bacterium]|nr:hypothetical protein [Vicinamibacterales bacterium]HWI16258.1 hypothetical protein [Vicinamibacterales bacterium]